jgi:chromosome partitioning protein
LCEPRITKTFAIISQKGESRKSTIAVYLAALTLRWGLVLAIIDLNPQASAFKWHEIRREDDPKAPIMEAISATVDCLSELQKLATENGKRNRPAYPPGHRAHSNKKSALAAQSADGVPRSVPSLFDLNAVTSTFKIINAVGKPSAVVINAASRGKLADEARETSRDKKSTFFLPCCKTAPPTLSP